MNDNLEANEVNATEELGGHMVIDEDSDNPFSPNRPSPEAIKYPDYVPCLHELKVLARYWRDKQADLATFRWLWDQISSKDLQMEDYAGACIGRIATIAGDDQIDPIVRDVDETYRRKLGDDAWAAFLRNDTEWRNRDLERIRAEMGLRKGGE